MATFAKGWQKLEVLTTVLLNQKKMLFREAIVLYLQHKLNYRYVKKHGMVQPWSCKFLNFSYQFKNANWIFANCSKIFLICSKKWYTYFFLYIQQVPLAGQAKYLLHCFSTFNLLSSLRKRSYSIFRDNLWLQQKNMP